jgi:Holliday junction resolvase-like predicted endonuclease
MLNPRHQGDLGELSAMEWLVEQGATVFMPVFHSPDVDLVADFGDRLIRVQVKTTTYFRNDRWSAAICTRGGNQSWSGVTKRFARSRCDALFVLVADGRRWYIPSAVIDSGTNLLLGGPKYARYEVDRGRPLPVPADERSLDSATVRRDTEAVKREAL